MPSLIFLKECESTNEEILPLINLGENDFQGLYTLNQTKGKGQYGNTWECAENLNLAFSLAVPAHQLKTQDHLLNFYTALLLAEFLAKMTINGVKIKWPNDIIINNKKVCGILSEKKMKSGTPYFIIGIGLNILQENFDHLPKAGSLLTQTGLKLNPNEVAQSLFGYLTSHITNPNSPDDIFERVNRQLFRKDIVSVFELKGIRQNGIIKNVDKEGFLWVDLENLGLQKFFHKEIELLY